MLVGLDLSSLREPVPEALWSSIRALRLQQFTISSDAPAALLDGLIDGEPRSYVHVLPSIAPQTSVWPRDILNHQPRVGAQTLGACLERLRRDLPAAHVLWVGGAKLPLGPERSEAPASQLRLHEYADWWQTEVAHIRKAFAGIPVAVAPLDALTPNQARQMVQTLRSLRCYDHATFLAERSVVIDSPGGLMGETSPGVALRESIPELGPIHNIETRMPINRRDPGAPLRRYIEWCARSEAYACLSLSLGVGGASSELEAALGCLSAGSTD